MFCRGVFCRLTGVRKKSRPGCHQVIGGEQIGGVPYLHRPHASGPIQWARGDVRRRAPLDSGLLRVARGGSGAKAPLLAAHPKPPKIF